jgi:hypothetical protein
MDDALRLIVAKSPRAAAEAVRTMTALRAGSPILQHRYQRVLEMALADPAAEFTSDERAVLADALTAGEAVESGTRDRILRVRLSPAEWADLEATAADSGETLSSYVRRQLFG